MGILCWLAGGLILLVQGYKAIFRTSAAARLSRPRSTPADAALPAYTSR